MGKRHQTKVIKLTKALDIGKHPKILIIFCESICYGSKRICDLDSDSSVINYGEM